MLFERDSAFIISHIGGYLSLKLSRGRYITSALVQVQGGNFSTIGIPSTIHQSVLLYFIFHILLSLTN